MIFLSFLCVVLYLCGYVLALYLCNAVARVFLTTFKYRYAMVISLFWPFVILYFVYDFISPHKGEE